MDFLKKSISTIDNAIEINKLKSEHDDLTHKITKIIDQLKKYDCQTELKQIIETNIEANQNTILGLKKQFFLDNIEKPENYTVDEFSVKYNNPYFIKLFQVYNNLLESSGVLQTTLNEINSHINIDKTTYQTKKEELEKELDSVNTRLRKVRNKQFPK
jgi:predicted  nucleic acid-binding Zn-ribbon protein